MYQMHRITSVKRIAALAQEFNSQIENIGARRLHTIMEKLLESISYDCEEKNGSILEIDSLYVDAVSYTHLTLPTKA